MREPFWMIRARKYVGVAEVKGPQHSPVILRLLDAADGKPGDGRTLQGVRDDETPWCAAFVSGVLEESTVPSTRSLWAKSYATYGTRLEGPALGAIAVFDRGANGGHVGFVAGRYDDGSLAVLGGNQSDAVRISKFNMSSPKLLGFRWPPGFSAPDSVKFQDLPLVNDAGQPVSSSQLS